MKTESWISYFERGKRFVIGIRIIGSLEQTISNY